MKIKESRREDVVVLGLKGRLDASTSNELEEQLLGLTSRGEKSLVVDFSQLDYISSSGLRVFLLVAKKLKKVNGTIVLCSMQDYIKEVFDIAGFSSIFHICLTQEEAVETAKGSQ